MLVFLHHEIWNIYRKKVTIIAKAPGVRSCSINYLKTLSLTLPLISRKRRHSSVDGFSPQQKKKHNNK
jgi:hypothetical protein